MQPRLDTEDTIAAIASTRGGQRGILRISGPRTAELLDVCTDVGPWRNVPGARRRRGTVFAGERFGRLPADVYFWPAGHSYTGQESGEIHSLGAAPLLDAVLTEVCHHGGRLARPGEFTLRAFLSGRLDLAQAEAVLGIIDAESSGDLDRALGQLAGGITGPLADMRGRLLDLVADLEAGLDFVEEDIQFVTAEHVGDEIAQCRKTIQELLSQIGARATRDEFARVALVGEPNAGKSSLLNCLVGERHALVTPLAGTTRDYVTARVTWEGVPIELIDTAGIESPRSEIEAAAQVQRESVVEGADVQLLCEVASRIKADRSLPSRNVLRVATQCDLLSAEQRSHRLRAIDGEVFSTSAVTGEGIEVLRRAIVRAVCDATTGPMLPGTAVRCGESLQRLTQSLELADQAVRGELGDEIVVGELREAIDALATIVGAVYTDDILDRVFSRFCIGK